MLPENKRFRDFLGVTAWHKAGYTGKRVLVASGENFERYPSTHAGETYRVFREFCPDAEAIYLPVAQGTFGATIQSKFVDYSIPEIIKRGVHVVWASLSPSVDGKFLDEPMKQIPYCTVLMSAGNDMGDAYNKFLTCEAIYGVGAYLLMADSSSPVPAHYTSITDYVDFAGPAGVEIPSANGNFSYPFSGTSCAAPVLAAMCALINDFFLDKTDRPLSSQMMYQFLQDYSKDIGVKGKDNKTGWGAPILPPPESIDIGRYAGEMLSSRNIDDLRPDVAANCYKMIEIAKADGWPILVTGTVRDREFQEYCYYKGTSKSKVPTFHSEAAGLAFDICKNIKGQEYSDNAFWDYCGALGKKMGFTWGGDWKSFVDKPHFQWDCNGRYSGNDILMGWYPPPMPLYEGEDEMTQEQFNALYDAVNPTYATLEDVPDYWKGETKALIDSGKLKGTGEGKLNIRHETLRAVIIGER